MLKTLQTCNSDCVRTWLLTTPWRAVGHAAVVDWKMVRSFACHLWRCQFGRGKTTQPGVDVEMLGQWWKFGLPRKRKLDGIGFCWGQREAYRCIHPEKRIRLISMVFLSPFQCFPSSLPSSQLQSFRNYNFLSSGVRQQLPTLGGGFAVARPHPSNAWRLEQILAGHFGPCAVNQQIQKIVKLFLIVSDVDVSLDGSERTALHLVLFSRQPQGWRWLHITGCWLLMSFCVSHCSVLKVHPQ